MEQFESELQRLSKLYRKLDHDLEGPDEADQDQSTAALIDRILRNGELVLQMEQMDARIAELAAKWKESRKGPEPHSERSVQKMLENLHHEGLHLRSILEHRSAQIESYRDHLGRRLAEVQTGQRFLQSVNPVKANYPKFIDSVG